MSLDVRRTGDALAAATEELARIWRAARAAERRDVFPGLLDGVIEPLFAVVGDAFADGRDAALVWPAVAGVVRVDARDAQRTREELHAEWELAEQVLHAACEALEAQDARDWVSRVIAAARAGAQRLPEHGDAPGVLAVRVFSGLGAARGPRGS